MQEIFNHIRIISRWEKLFLILTFISVLIKHVFNIKETIDIVVFGIILGILYFPLVFHFLRLPINNRLFFPIISGFIYAIGVVSVLFETLRLDGDLLNNAVKCCEFGMCRSTVVTLSEAGHLRRCK